VQPKQKQPKAHHKKRTAGKSGGEPGSAPTHLFGHLLDKSDTPPDVLTMYALYRTAMQFGQVQPWLTVHETEVFAVDPPDRQGPRCYCSVLGSGGTMYRLQVYLDNEGYGLFHRMSSGKLRDRMEMFTSCSMVFVEYVPPRELTKPDREMLKLFGCALDRDGLWPIFRSIRKGSADWYVNAREASILMECLRAGVVITAQLSQDADVTYWKDKNSLPLVRVDVSGSDVRTSIGQTRVPEHAPPKAEGVVNVDKNRIDRVVALLEKMKYECRAWELDWFWCPARIGKAAERPRFARIAMVVDADTGYVFPPEMEEASLPAPELMAEAVLSGLGAKAMLPVELHVRGEDRRRAIAPLADALGLKIVVKKTLPQLDACKAAFESHMLGGR
jgi:hypothetical protein